MERQRRSGNIGLSKSKLIAGRQCAKRLYLEVHRPELLEGNQESAIMQSGTHVGEVARTLFTDGYLIEHDNDLPQALSETKSVLEKGVPAIFEATVEHDGVLVRADIMEKKQHGYRLIEVKGATSVKEYHLDDCAIQSWVMRQAGIPVERIELAHINNQFVYQGDSDYRGLFTFADVAGDVRPRINHVSQWVDEARSVLSGGEPTIDPGDQCTDPYECPFLSHCVANTTAFPVSLLPRAGSLVEALLNEGYEDLRDVPEGRLSNNNHERIRRITASGQAELDGEAAEVINALGYPRYYLDFETLSLAVPIWKDTRPYQQYPFQWSCHVEQSDRKLTHLEFLPNNDEDPMRALAESMIDVLGDEGPILMYSSYERTVINKLIERFPDLVESLNGLVERLVDLLPITRNYYYHPDMKGSWSIKAVLPTVAPDLNYADLDEVQDGMAAGVAYREMINQATGDDRKAQLDIALRRYCKLDTEAMVHLARFLSK